MPSPRSVDAPPPAAPPRAAGWRSYHEVTRTATYGFLAAVPLVLLYEVLIVVFNEGDWSQVRVGAEVWLKQLLAMVGGVGMMALGAVLLLVGAVIFFLERKRRLPLRPRYLLWMVAESAVYAVVVALLVSQLVQALFAVAASGQIAEAGVGLQLALSIGAGIYEELVFRVLLVGGLAWGLKHLLGRQRAAYVAAAVVGALVFSAVHYVGALGDVFTLSSFTFRFLFGLALNALYLVRGFGVAAWTHALYDVLVVVILAG